MLHPTAKKPADSASSPRQLRRWLPAGSTAKSRREASLPDLDGVDVHLDPDLAVPAVVPVLVVPVRVLDPVLPVVVVPVEAEAPELLDGDDREEDEQDRDGEALEAAAFGHGGTRRRGRPYERAAPELRVSPLPPSFFARPTLQVARDLLGALLVYDSPDDGRLAGRIVETEGYRADDPAMHGWKATFGDDGRVRPVGRAADLFAAPGTAYVYKVYYTHWLLNVVTEPEGEAGAVLIRAVEPVEGEAAMTANRPASVRRRRDLTNGPGKLTQAFGINEGPEATASRFHGADLTAPPLFFAEGDVVPDARVEVTSRIGISRGIDLDYRFVVADSPFVSPGEPSAVRRARKTGGG